jgi:hypothetical protein
MTAPFLALITPLGEQPPVQPPQPPLGIWGPSDPRPTLPIAGWNPGTGGWPTPQPPQPPLVIWGPGDPRPTLPIAGWDPGSGAFPKPPGQPPLGFWGPNDPRPSNPIAEPPWGWGNPPPPITLPPEVPGVLPGKVDWKTAWTPTTGWVVIGIPAEGTLVPTPSKG